MRLEYGGSQELTFRVIMAICFVLLISLIIHPQGFIAYSQVINSHFESEMCGMVFFIFLVDFYGLDVAPLIQLIYLRYGIPGLGTRLEIGRDLFYDYSVGFYGSWVVP